MDVNNIIIKITSEADLDEAQRQLKNLTDQSDALEREMLALKDAEKEDAKSIKSLGLEASKLGKRLKENRDYYRGERANLKSANDERKKSIKSLESQIKSYKTLQGQSGKVVTQLRAMQERLMEMEDAGEFGSEAFINLSIAAGELENRIDDTRQRIRVLASDTKEMDAIMGLGDGLAGAFYAATSGAELFGDDIEGLQEAFYKVQAAMSVVNGVQQVFNALNKDSAAMVVLNTALNKLRERQAKKNAVATNVDRRSSEGNTAAMGAQSIATGVLTKAQHSLNAAMKANPIGFIIGVVMAAVAAFKALASVFSSLTGSQNSYKKASEELERVEAQNANGAAMRALKRQQQIQKTSEDEDEELRKARERNASELEMAEIKEKYAKKNAEQTKKWSEEEIKRRQEEVNKAKEAMDAAKEEYKTSGGLFARESRKQKRYEKWIETQEKYAEKIQAVADAERENTEAIKASKDATEALQRARENLSRQLEQTNIDLMRDGAAKEIAQIKFNYEERLKEYQGEGEDETKMRVALEKMQQKEINEVRRKYARQRINTQNETLVQERQNLLNSMAKGGLEEAYQKELQLTKEIYEAEAQAQIDSLDKRELGERLYNAKVVAIKQDLADKIKQIDDQEANRQNEIAKRRTEIAIAEAEAEANALDGSESIERQVQVWDRYYAEREAQIRQNAAIEKASIQASIDTEEVKADKIRQLELNMQAEITQNASDEAEKRIEIESRYLDELERNVTKTQDAVDRAQGGSKIKALDENYKAQMALYEAQQEELEKKYLKKKSISFQEYKQQEFEITKAIADAEYQYQSDRIEAITDVIEKALDNMQQVSDLAFEAIGNSIQAQIDQLDEMYTTDWEEAQKNADKKYITEKEYQKKKAELEKKQAKYAKAQALINAAINTALAITAALTQAPPASYVMAALSAAMGAAQIAVIASKPLAQYEKGRKGGEGEYAIVGEKGAELMYVPRGASIVPHNKIANQEAWAAYGVPKLNVPELPSADSESLRNAAILSAVTLSIDYDKLGEAVAHNIPRQNPVTVNVDRSGVSVNNGHGTHTHLNRKYAGTWN